MSSRRDRTLRVDTLARVEGEGSLYAKIRRGKLKELRFRIYEPPRFFEAFLRGKGFAEVPDITARICGICPVAYQMSSVHALEGLFGTRVPAGTRELRRLLYCAEYIESHCLRDLTRGGLATALNEIAETAGLRIAVSEEAVPVRREVAAACELLGLDPLYMACEGRFIAFVPEAQADLALKTLERSAPGRSPALIGSVAGGGGEVVLKTRLGVDRVLDMLTGEQLPRIC
ncbi:MAG: AIR synthase-related protein [Elusimicrobiota bacterium]